MGWAADARLDLDGSSVKGVVDALDTRQQGIEGRTAQLELRLDRRYDFLIRRFTALEQAMAEAQNQMTGCKARWAHLAPPAASSEN